MGLYLCVFDGDEEVEGVEVGSYADFNFFRDAAVAALAQAGEPSDCPTLLNHSDCDGSWSPLEAQALESELKAIELAFQLCPPIELNVAWKKDAAKLFGLVPKHLGDCFFDVDGEPLVARLRALALISVDRALPILFQ